MSIELSEGQVIQAAFLPEPAIVKKFEPRRSFYVLEYVLKNSKKFDSINLTQDQLEQISLVQPDSLTAIRNPEDFFLYIEANRVRMAYQFDPMLAISTSQVDPLPHQIEAVYDYALEQPRLRFMIADDPGAGKTVMAGLILKEMQYRGLVKRVLIVAPGHLKFQWLREMRDKFQTNFRIVDRSTMRSHFGENVWEENPLSITSIDFLKQEDIKITLNSARWDLVIVDEAHKMSAYEYETSKRREVKETKRYKVGKVLSRQTEHMLFLTATPHKGDPKNFRLFLDLLRPGFFANEELLREAVNKNENPVFIRRLKEDMTKFDGSDIFPPRYVKTTTFKLSDPEVELYNAVTNYVRNYYNQAKENRHITFAMMILQRRLTSSVHAILSSLKKRRGRLEELLRLPEKIQQNEIYEEVKNISIEELEDLAEEDRMQIEEKMEHLTIAKNIDEVKTEIEEVDKLIALAEEVKKQEVESKLRTLKDEILDTLQDRKLLIFTEHKDTLYYLQDKLSGWGYSVSVIHGGMHLDQRIDKEREFKEESQILVATEAAGEGINLQFCSWMVNYDIPWNPNRLEQRMGRIHRYGQDHEVFIWNLVARNTREGQILEKLFAKLDKMREELGSDRVFDIIGEVIPGTNLKKLLQDAIFSQRRMEEIETTIDQVDQDSTEETLERLFLTSLATRFIDYSDLNKKAIRAEEHRLVPEYIQDYFLRGFAKFGGKYTRTQHGYRIDFVPYDMRKLSDNYSFKTSFGKIHREYKRVTFDKQVAKNHADYDLIAPGHPLLEAYNELVFTNFIKDNQPRAFYSDPEKGREGILWFVKGVVQDGTGDKAGERIFCLYQDTENSIQQIDPSILWDLEPVEDGNIPQELRDLMDSSDSMEDYLFENILLSYKSEIEERRRQRTDVKKRYGLKSLDYLISESNQKLMEYRERADDGVDMGLPIRRERRWLEEYEDRRKELKEEIRLESNITIQGPEVLGIGILLPASEEEEPATPSDLPGKSTGTVDPERKKEIEQVGMNTAIQFETDNGWEPEDVSDAEHGGFDIRSMRIDEDGGIADVRYIEVKARAQSGAIRLTSNEWKKARHFGEKYWMYIVTQSGTDEPDLKRIQDPAIHFVEEEDIFATGFIIPEERWQLQG